MTLDIKALARAAYDPDRWRSQYKDEVKRLQGAADQQYAAQLGDSRSVENNISNPSDSRSLIARDYPGVFHPMQEAQDDIGSAPRRRQRPAQQLYGDPAAFQDLYRDTFEDLL